MAAYHSIYVGNDFSDQSSYEVVLLVFGPGSPCLEDLSLDNNKCDLIKLTASTIVTTRTWFDQRTTCSHQL